MARLPKRVVWARQILAVFEDWEVPSPRLVRRLEAWCQEKADELARANAAKRQRARYKTKGRE